MSLSPSFPICKANVMVPISEDPAFQEGLPIYVVSAGHMARLGSAGVPALTLLRPPLWHRLLRDPDLPPVVL